MKEKDYIEELILKNLEALNDNEPMDGHFDRFEARLNQQHSKYKFSWSLVWKAAAVVVFALLITNQAFIYFSPDQQGFILNARDKSDITLASLSPEYEETEFYYQTSIRSGLNQWDELTREGYVSEEEQRLMQNELNDFETRFKNLQEDLAANPNDERVINAMLEYYQVKLSVINMIVNKLEEVKQQKNTSYENL
ncbi:hypothetical protein [Maribellus sp. YY47]|uniref:hypothetical protein n=1 Tax=Maribellus sp. YY47 TaxID=2929486 RepID=UPI002000DE48|nr:hypothetical protein [Maribellus sp. YY47]MCK3684422.1 hypothetical protein [Maribellus sp. YY47]